jgi:tetratricopeptide (TPR) repeat protein
VSPSGGEQIGSPTLADRAWALALGFALMACAVGLAQGWFDRFEAGVGPFAGVALGVGIGTLFPRKAGALFFGLGGLGLLLGPGGVLLSTEVLGGALLFSCGVGAGAVLADLGIGAVATAGYVALGAGGAALGASLLGPEGFWINEAWIGVGAFVGVVAGLRKKAGAVPATAGARGLFGARKDAGLAALVGLRLGSTAVVAVSAAALLGASGQSLGLAGGAIQIAPALAFGFALGVLPASGWRLLESRAVLVLSEPFGWLLVLSLGYRAPEWLLNEGFGLRLAAGVSACLAGLALIGPLRRGGAWGLIALVLAWPLGGAVFDASASHWRGADRAALALGVRGPAADQLSAAVTNEAVRIRFDELGATSVSVVDVESGRRKLRLLSVNGAVLGSVPTHAAGKRDVMKATVLGAALPILCAAEPPKRVALLGLETGVAAGTLLRVPTLDELRVVEPLGGVVRAHTDPGDLFGYVSHRPLLDSRTSVRGEPIATFLRLASETRWDALVLSRSVPYAWPFRRLVPAHTTLYVWRLVDVVPHTLRGARAWVFDGGDDSVLLVGGEDATVSAARFEERLAASPDLAEELARVGLDGPYAVLATLICGPESLGALTSTDTLVAAGASGLAQAIDFGEGSAAAERMAKLAVRLALRKSPAALPMAQAAVKRERSDRTLRTLGDLLLQRGAAKGALEAWTQALTLEPSSVSTRLSLAVFHTKQREWALGLKVLAPALGRDPTRDHQVHYHLGELELGAKNYGAARGHFRKAGRFKNAEALKALATQLGGPAAPKTVPPSIKLRAAGKLVDRARASRGAQEARRLWGDATAALVSLAEDTTQLSKPQQLLLARLLDRCAETRDAASRSALLRLEARILAPFATGGRLAIKRARVLARAGDPDGAERILQRLTEEGDARAEASRALGDVLAGEKKLGPAIGAWQRSIRLSPQSSIHARVYLAIADAQTTLRQLGRALKTLETAERLQPGHPGVRLALADALLANGKGGEARDAYRAFLEVAPARHPARERAEGLSRRGQ